MASTRSTRAKTQAEVTPSKQGQGGKPSGSKGPVKLRSVRPGIPEKEDEKSFLMKDLVKMELEKLMDLPWAIQSEDMIWELQGQAVPDEFKGTKWNEVDIAKAFGKPKEGLKMLPRGDDRLKPFFSGKIDPRDGFGVE
ncbi:unnamed protein product [Calypogeia fissa]